MPWTFVRPEDASLLDARPLLDLGIGDGQTLAGITRLDGLVVGIDRAPELLGFARRLGARVMNADARSLPFSDASFATVVAGDLFHHLDDDELDGVLGEIGRVLVPGGQLVAWWYSEHRRPAPDAPRFPRTYEAVAARISSFRDVVELDLEVVLEPSPPTTGVVATR